MTDAIKLTHPGSKQQIEVRPEHAAKYREQGWVEAEKPEPKK